jgi:predicted lipid-binding transport protein (Tim44 family)
MTFGKAFALTAALLGALALGVWVGPYITHRATPVTEAPATSVAEPAAPESPPQQAAHAPRTTSRKSAARPAPAVIPASADDVRAHVKPLLNRGSDVAIASQGFRDAEQFAAVAHAARNTEIPFMLLKHRVLNEGKTLATAISESKPDMNAVLEANRARAEARADLAKLRG